MWDSPKCHKEQILDGLYHVNEKKKHQFLVGSGFWWFVALGEPHISPISQKINTFQKPQVNGDLHMSGMG